MKKLFFLIMFTCLIFSLEARRHCHHGCRGGCGGGVIIVERPYWHGPPPPPPYPYGPGPYWGHPYWAPPPYPYDPYYDPYDDCGGGFYFQWNFR